MNRPTLLEQLIAFSNDYKKIKKAKGRVFETLTKKEIRVRKILDMLRGSFRALSVKDIIEKLGEKIATVTCMVYMKELLERDKIYTVSLVGGATGYRIK